MRKREDVLFYFIYEMIYPEKDTIIIDIPIKCEVPVVFLVANKKKVKSYSEANLDINKLTGRFEVNNLNNSYQILGESADIVDSIIDNYMVKKLNEFNGLFLSIHYTDQKMFSESKGHLRVIINASHKNTEHFLPAVELIFHLVDKMVALKLSANNKVKAQKAR
jgi:hypothetical protein